jgi:ElaB/YqjD/DUF883 family membrane-anchored ribosome-binding protein
METTTPTTAAKVGTLNLNKPLSAAPLESTQAATSVGDTVDRTAQGATATGTRAPQTSRFPTRARAAGPEGQASVENRIEDFFSGQDWAESARNAVRAHPLAIVGIALVAGLLVGRL